MQQLGSNRGPSRSSFKDVSTRNGMRTIHISVIKIFRCGAIKNVNFHFYLKGNYFSSIRRMTQSFKPFRNKEFHRFLKVLGK